MIFQRVRRWGDARARKTFAVFVDGLINPERFVEPRKADTAAVAAEDGARVGLSAPLAGGRPAEITSGKSTSGEECQTADARVGLPGSRGDETTGVRGTAWRSARIV